MAITWDVQIEVLDLPTRKIRVTATRTDDVLLETRTYAVIGKYDTAVNTKQEILDHYTDAVWGEYQRELLKESRISTLIEDSETALKTALEARET